MPQNLERRPDQQKYHTDMLYSAMLIVLRENYSVQDINTTPIEPKTEREVSSRQLFRRYCGSKQ